MQDNIKKMFLTKVYEPSTKCETTKRLWDPMLFGSMLFSAIFVWMSYICYKLWTL
jgi:hypothetical protein